MNQSKPPQPRPSKGRLQRPALAQRYRSAGLSLYRSGRLPDAVSALVHALRLDPACATVHFSLAMMARRHPWLKIDMHALNRRIPEPAALVKAYGEIQQTLNRRMAANRHDHAEAIVCHEEICRLQPDNAIARGNLGLILNIAGRHEDAAVALARAVLTDPDNRMLRPVFTAGIGHAPLSAFHPEIRAALQICLETPYAANLGSAFSTWYDLIRLSPKTSVLVAAASLDDSGFTRWANNLDEAGISPLRDRFFLAGLRVLILASPALEVFLTRLRRWLCLAASGAQRQRLTPFLCALAEQCYFNEYIYRFSQEESAVVAALVARADALSAAELALLACYEPLHKVYSIRPVVSCPDCAHLLKTQYEDPIEERQLATDIPAFGAIEHPVSLSVQKQYEQNPYPRWVSAASVPSPVDDIITPKHRRYHPFSILVAGCGTGQQAVYAAAKHPNALVTAIDLSRSSLAYALRKAREAGLDKRIRFIQADIRELHAWPGEFDIIECSGVLHHMEDPFEGWRTLTGLLKAGGYFNIGLYSRTARRHITAAHNMIKAGGFAATPAAMRDCRRSIMSLPAGHSLRLLLKSNDFYTLSRFRDLLFHSHAQTVTLPQIKDMLARLQLEFLRFSIACPATANRYTAQFPEDPERSNLDNWMELEKAHPGTFAGMYQFWARKRG